MTTVSLVMKPSEAQSPTRPIVVASNRGPVTFSFVNNETPIAKRAGGGLASAIGNAIINTDSMWLAAATSKADSQVAASGVVEAEGFRLRLLDIEPDTYSAYYNTISNGTLWFLNHGLFDATRRPRYDRHWHAAWELFKKVNSTFSQALVEQAPENALVLVHDYHLSLVGKEVSAKRADIATIYFHHTPFCRADELAMLPETVSLELMSGLNGFSACGFHAQRWASAFEECAIATVGSSPKTFVAPAATDSREIDATLDTPECKEALKELNGRVGTRKVIVRVDRIELSKNLLRGFLAYEELLETKPEWRDNVVFVACVYPSREGIIEYQAYSLEVEGLVRRINERWKTQSWTPIIYEASNNYPRSIAALSRYDVLLVNPIRDGLNLVAKEGPLANQNDGVLALSRTTGAWDELGGVALGVNPFDIVGTSNVLHNALSMNTSDRKQHAQALRERASARTPDDWFQDQINAAITE